MPGSLSDSLLATLSEMYPEPTSVADLENTSSSGNIQERIPDERKKHMSYMNDTKFFHDDYRTDGDL
jgi:hypothetical protein